ncbi:MAG: chromate transporter [Lachnospiraceae bacterium]
MIYLQLFLAFLHIGAFSFGGGYAAMPLIQEQVIDKYHWLTIEDFTDLVTISQMTPGPIAVNAATFVGAQIAGIPGSIVATAGVVLPSCIFVSVLAWLYVRYRNLTIMQGVLTSLRPAVTSMIFAAGLLILIPALFPEGIAAAASDFQVRQLIYFIAALVCLRKFKIGPIKVMVGCGAAELVVRLVMMAAGS